MFALWKCIVEKLEAEDGPSPCGVPLWFCTCCSLAWCCRCCAKTLCVIVCCNIWFTGVFRTVGVVIIGPVDTAVDIDDVTVVTLFPATTPLPMLTVFDPALDTATTGWLTAAVMTLDKAENRVALEFKFSIHALNPRSRHVFYWTGVCKLAVF